VGGAVELAGALTMGAAVAEPAHETEPQTGLECPNCACRHFKTVRTVPKQRYIWRRRKCERCGRLWTTTERLIG
jgi:hypothetical protein